jgi:hypothetical protein
MVKDSIAKKFIGSPVSVAGVITGLNPWVDSVFYHDINITFPVVKNGRSICGSYSISTNPWNIGFVVIDRHGVVRFVEQQMNSGYDKMVSMVASTVRSLLAIGIIRYKTTTAFVGRDNGTPRYYSLSGQTIAHPITSVSSIIVLGSLGGRVTSFAHLQ